MSEDKVENNVQVVSSVPVSAEMGFARPIIRRVLKAVASCLEFSDDSSEILGIDEPGRLLKILREFGADNDWDKIMACGCGRNWWAPKREIIRTCPSCLGLGNKIYSLDRIIKG